MQKRLFAAIKIEPDDNFITLYSSLKKLWKGHKINWVPLNLMHITFHFFGDTEVRIIPDIIKQLMSAVSNISAFEIGISKLGIFGSSYKPRVIWMGIDPNENVKILSQNITDNLSNIGYIPDRQNFIPHLTIGRIKFIDDKQQFQKQLDEVKERFVQLSVADRLYLFESILSSEGPTYHIIETFHFKNN